MAAASPGSAAAKKAQSAKSSRDDVTISETFGKKFALEKPPVELEVPLESFLPPSEAASPRSVPGGKDAESDRILLEALGFPESRHVMKPWLADIPGASPVEFEVELPRGLEAKSWELEIFDPRGRSVSTISGSDQPPAKVKWDMKTLSGLPVQVGVPYAYRLKVTDRHRKKRSFLGKSFTLQALQYQDTSRGKVIEIALGALFEPKKAALRRAGADQLLRALEIVTESRASSFRFLLQDSSEPSLLEGRIQALRQFASRELVMPESQIAFESLPTFGRGAVLQVLLR